jgi:hypothetical protein
MNIFRTNSDKITLLFAVAVGAVISATTMYRSPAMPNMPFAIGTQRVQTSLSTQQPSEIVNLRKAALRSFYVRVVYRTMTNLTMSVVYIQMLEAAKTKEDLQEFDKFFNETNATLKDLAKQDREDWKELKRTVEATAKTVPLTQDEKDAIKAIEDFLSKEKI